MRLFKIVIIASYCAMISESSQLLCSSEYTHHSFILKNHAIQELQSQTKSHCEEECASHNECQSINFYPNLQKCTLNNENHLTSPVDLTHDAHGVYSHVVKVRSPFNTCSDSYCSTDQICLAKDDGKDYECKVCTAPLGMQSNAIPNSAVTASSSFSSNAHISWRARLHNYPPMPYNGTVNIGAWCAKYNNVGEYLQIDIGRVVNLKQVATHGRPYLSVQYIKKYRLAYKRADTQWLDYREGVIVKIFNGNSDRDTVVTNTLKEKVVAQYVRIIIWEWNHNICMRVEIYGC